MPIPKKRTRKHFQLDSRKIKRVQRILKAKTETEAIELALDLALAQYPRTGLNAEANERVAGSRFANR
jgi:hypothetical protein